MMYSEHYIFFRRTFQLTDASVVANGEGWFNPNYSAEFAYEDLNPKPQRIKIANRYRLIPLLLITPLLGASMMLLAAWHEKFSEPLLLINLILLVLSCLTTLGVVFTKQWWAQYVNTSGLPCIGFIERPGLEPYLAFRNELEKRIHSAR